MTKITIENAAQEKDTKHSVGQYYLLTDEGGCEDVYLLAQVGYSVVNLFSLNNGNRYSDPVKVVNQFNISQEEMGELVVDKTFTLLSSVDIRYLL